MAKPSRDDVKTFSGILDLVNTLRNRLQCLPHTLLTEIPYHHCTEWYKLVNRGILFLLLAMLAEIVGTVGGFGSSVFVVPIALVTLRASGKHFTFHHKWFTALVHTGLNVSLENGCVKKREC